MTRDASFKRRVRRRMAKTGEAYTTARARLDRRTAAGATRRVLHVTNGDSVRRTLHASGVVGQVLAWRDVLYDGPVPGGLTLQDLRRVRAEHLAARYEGEIAAIEQELATRDRMLDAYADGEYMLWFEADLYDQLQLVQVLDRLIRIGVDPVRMMLISVGEYRGIAHFVGLGQLHADQLGGLVDEAVPLSSEALALASAAWAALTAAAPTDLATISRARSPQLRFVGEAFARLEQEYPSRSDGLSLTERRILLAAQEGTATAAQMFRRVMDKERRPFLGDASFFNCLWDLAVCEAPLLAIGDRQRPPGDRTVRLTAMGERVLAGQEDHVRLNGIDRWIGGVHLTAGSPPWRYDERLESLVRV